ncbi:MAG: PH domain-containing protein [Pyrinomonadaceae bacterium]
MYCEKCGADNSESAKFCRKCGAETDIETETRVAVRALKDEPEAEIFSISPTLMFVKAGYALAAVGALLLVALVSVFLPTIISVWIAILLGLMLFLIPAFYHFKQKMVRYTLTDSKLEIDSGFISRTTRNMPIRRIQDVTVSTTVVQRILGFGDLVIDNASEEDGKAVLKNINSPKHYADAVLKQMRDSER